MCKNRADSECSIQNTKSGVINNWLITPDIIHIKYNKTIYYTINNWLITSPHQAVMPQLFISSAGVVIPPIPKFSIRTFATFGDKNAGKVGPR